MMKWMDNFLNYLKHASKEELEEDQKKLELWSKVGPKIEDLIKKQKRYE